MMTNERKTKHSFIWYFDKARVKRHLFSEQETMDLLNPLAISGESFRLEKALYRFIWLIQFCASSEESVHENKVTLDKTLVI